MRLNESVPFCNEFVANLTMQRREHDRNSGSCVYGWIGYEKFGYAPICTCPISIWYLF